MNGFGQAPGGSDPFTRFWSEMASRMTGAGMPAFQQQPGTQEAMLKAMRQAFFEAWAQHCEEFLASEAFLESMKQSMDSAMAFKEQLNTFMAKAVEGGPFSTRSDTEAMVQSLRSIEERVIERLESIEQRVGELENGRAKTTASGGSGTRSKGGKSR